MNAQRLLELAAHLRQGKLGHVKFNFEVCNGDEAGIQLWGNGCGYCGCAIGELPFVFPGAFEFVVGWPALIEADDYPHPDADFAGRGAAEAFFELKDEESMHLFIPNSQKPDKFGGQHLDENATAAQVADNIEAFVKRKEKEGK